MISHPKSGMRSTENIYRKAMYYTIHQHIAHYDDPPETLSRLGLGVDPIEYRYNEGDTIDELKQYIDSTYDQHYSKNKFQATEFIIDGGHGEGFCIGNIMKYAQRYGNKDGYNKKDLMKVLHYAIIMLYVHDHLGRD